MHVVETMAFAGAVPWHGLGTRVPAGVTDPAEMLTAAGLDWRVVREPLYTQYGTQAPGFAIMRESDKNIFGVVGPRYRPLQNVDAFDWFRPFVESGAAEFHTAGALHSGAKIWILAKMSGDDLQIRRDDSVERYILLSNSHDGTTAVRVGYTPIRVVCANTLAMAHGADASSLVRVRHGRRTNGALDAVRAAMDVANERFVATAEVYRWMAARYISRADLKKFIVESLDLDAEKPGRVLDDVTRLFETGKGSTASTLWDAYNAVTEYASWEYGRTVDTRINALWFGTSAKLIDRAFNVAAKF